MIHKGKFKHQVGVLFYTFCSILFSIAATSHLYSGLIETITENNQDIEASHLNESRPSDTTESSTEQNPITVDSRDPIELAQRFIEESEKLRMNLGDEISESRRSIIRKIGAYNSRSTETDLEAIKSFEVNAGDDFDPRFTICRRLAISEETFGFIIDILEGMMTDLDFLPHNSTIGLTIERILNSKFLENTNQESVNRFSNLLADITNRKAYSIDGTTMRLAVLARDHLDDFFSHQSTVSSLDVTEEMNINVAEGEEFSSGDAGRKDLIDNDYKDTNTTSENNLSE